MLPVPDRIGPLRTCPGRTDGRTFRGRTADRRAYRKTRRFRRRQARGRLEYRERVSQPTGPTKNGERREYTKNTVTGITMIKRGTLGLGATIILLTGWPSSGTRRNRIKPRLIYIYIIIVIGLCCCWNTSRPIVRQTILKRNERKSRYVQAVNFVIF